MESKKGYIYIRYHNSYGNHCKIGKTYNIPNRESTYITNEVMRGNFEYVYEFQDMKIVDILDIKFKDMFDEYNHKGDAGTEFFKKDVIPNIEPFFDTLNIKYNKLSKTEIDNLLRPPKKIKIKLKELYHIREYQHIIINKSVEYFNNNNKGILVLPCGIGKTLISLWITQYLNCNSILIGVPNLLLLDQWYDKCKYLFTNYEYLFIKGNIKINTIKKLLENSKKCIIISTYDSIFKVKKAISKLKMNYIFDMKIYDEVHHLTTLKYSKDMETKTYTEILNIESNKLISLTATLKHIENINKINTIICNNDINHFGKIIEKKSLLWAIQNKIICDYEIQSIIMDEENIEEYLERFNITDDKDKSLFLSSLSALKSIYHNNSKNLLIYVNTQINCNKIVEYIKKLINDNYINIPGLYFSTYHSELKNNIKEEIINNFKKCSFGILTCVYCLGEGWDFPKLDGVVFAENMTSNIRIVQSALRASRKDINNPDKITKIILPILNIDEYFNDKIDDNNDIKKVREIIYQIGIEDETIIQKIKVYKIHCSKLSPNKSSKRDNKNLYNNFEYFDTDLTNKLKLKTIKRNSFGLTYDKAKVIIKSKRIFNKENYIKLCDIDIRMPKEPEIFFKTQFKNWIDYLNIQYDDYYDFNECKKKINEYLILYPKIKEGFNFNYSYISKKLCNIDEKFPPYGLWLDFYDIKSFENLIIINKKKKKKGLI